MDSIEDEERDQHENATDESEKELNDTLDLEEEKRNRNELNIEGNIAQTQIFIQNLNSYNTKQNWKVEEEEVFDKSNKKYNLYDVQECTEFVELHKNDIYLSTAIVLSVFEAVALSELSELSGKLLEYLPKPVLLCDNGTDIQSQQQNSYISLKRILSVIGGQSFVTNAGRTYMGMGEDSNKVLDNILELFPNLRSSVVEWLFEISEIYKFRTTFDIYQIATAFARITSLDILNSKKTIFPRLYSSSDNVWLMGVIVYKLYNNELLKKEATQILLQWLTSRSRWLWKSACLSYTIIAGEKRDNLCEKEITRALRKKIHKINGYDLNYIAILLIQSKMFRTVVSKVFCTEFDCAGSREERLTLVQIYIRLLRYSYYKVNRSYVDLPLVACDTREQQENLTNIVECMISTYQMRRQLYIILEAYLKELSSYSSQQSTVDHVTAYFYNMALSDRVHRRDVLDFLRECDNEVSEKIYNRLVCIYEKKGV